MLRLLWLFAAIFHSCAWAWTPGLKEAAMAVAQGKGTRADEMMIFVHNHEMNLMAQAGELHDFSYAGAQDRFQEIQKKILDETFRNTPYRSEVSANKLNPGTDTDVNVFRADGKPMSLEDIKAVEGRYQRAVRTEFDGEALPSGRIDTKTDFMPHPQHTTPDEFKKIAQHINANGGTAYTDPMAAAAQSKLGSPAKLSLSEAGAFQKELHTLAESRMAAAAELRSKAAAIGTSNPGEYARLQAQATQYEYQAAKYHERMSAMNNHLRNQFGLGPEKGVLDDAAKAISNIGRNPYSASQVAQVRDLHGKALQNSSERFINTLLDVAKKEPASLQQVKALVNAEVRALHAAGAPKAAAQAAIRMEQTVQKVEAAAKWTAYKQTAKNVATKIPVMAIAGGAILGYQGVQIALTDVKATDTVWDFIRNCYYHAAWEGTGIGTAFERAQREEIERYLKEFDAGRDPSMAKHVTFTLLKTGVYLGEDMIIGVLTLPDTIWEAFTQEKEMEAYAAMQNDLARVMRQMINDRRAFEDLMMRMRKLGLRDEDARFFLDCMCRSCGGSLGGLYNPSFKGEIGHGPCQCNGPLTIWKAPLPVGDTKVEYACFNAVTKMRYDQAQDIFNKWHEQAAQENARSVAAELDAIKQALDTSKLERDEQLVRDLADRAAAIKPLLLPQDLDHLQAMLDPFLANHAERDVEAGDFAGALSNYDRILNRLGTRNASERDSFERRHAMIKAWQTAWAEVKEKKFPDIDRLLQKKDPHAAAGELEALEYRMTKEVPRRIPFATKDPDFLALKARVEASRKAYAEAVQQAWKQASELRQARDHRGAVAVLESVAKDWVHPVDTQQSFARQTAYHQGELARAQALAAQGAASEQRGALEQAIAEYKQSLEIQRDDALTRRVQALSAQLERNRADQQARKEQARQLRDQAHAMQQQGRIAEAIGLYKQSLALWPDKELEAFVAQLERGLADQQARKEQARQLRDQAHAVQQQGRIAEAIGLYKQSLALWPDKELEAFVAQLERGLADRQARKAQAKQLR
ncbi:MAG: tetratricopeptide repeat protein, partial [Pseudomonadota bacterium]